METDYRNDKAVVVRQALNRLPDPVKVHYQLIWERKKALN